MMMEIVTNYTDPTLALFGITWTNVLHNLSLHKSTMDRVVDNFGMTDTLYSKQKWLVDLKITQAELVVHYLNNSYSK